MKHFFFSIFFIPFFFLSCGGNSVSIVSLQPSGEVDLRSSITLEFSAEIAPPDIRDKWLDSSYITFNPPISGKYKWITGSTLVFTPASPLKPMQTYNVHVTDNVLALTEFSSDFDSLTFNTPSLKPLGISVFYISLPEDITKPGIQLNVQFNYPVSPDALKKNIRIEKNGDAVSDYTMLSTQAAKTLSILLPAPASMEEADTYTVSLSEGLLSTLSSKPMDEDFEFERELSLPSELWVLGVSSSYDGTNAVLEVETNQAVNEKILKDYLTLEPNQPFTITVDKNCFKIYISAGELTSVHLSLREGLTGLFGGTLKEAFDSDISLIDLEPAINFADRSGKYLLLNGERNIQVNSVNVDAVDIQVSQIYQNNLFNYVDRYGYASNSEWGYYSPSYSIDNFGTALYSEKKSLRSKSNWLEKFTINLSKVFPRVTKGLFIVRVSSTNNEWTNDSKLVAISDLGIIAKQSANQLIVFVNSLEGAQPLKGVKVSVISSTNQAVLTGETDGDGVVRFDDLSGIKSNEQPRLIIAEYEGDFNYIDLEETAIETSRYDVGGISEHDADFRTFIYLDRNLYRPGEIVHLSAILRNDKLETLSDVPVVVKIIGPTGKPAEEFKQTTNQAGSIEFGWETPEFTPTGAYRAEVSTAAGKLIGTYIFSIEDFVPDKIRLLAAVQKEKVSVNETNLLSLDAEFLFGAKASNLPYSVETQFTAIDFKSNAYPDYNFACAAPKRSEPITVNFDGMLDSLGRTSIPISFADTTEYLGLMRASSYISVIDLTGRPVNRTAYWNINLNPFYVGVYSSSYYTAANQAVSFKLTAVDGNDKLKTGVSVTAKLVRYEWRTALKAGYYGSYYYDSEEKEIVEWEKEIPLTGAGVPLDVRPTRSGRYELRISPPGTSTYIKSEFYVYGYANTTAASFEVDKEGRVDIVTDKKSYSPGEKAKVLFTGPFSGNMLVTIERNGVFSYRYLKMENKSAELILPITDEYMPNVYISATLFKKHTPERETPFLVGHGYASITVERPENKLPVTIIAPEKAKPNSKQTITVETIPKRDVYVTISAVDEGILQIFDYKTPDPYAFMYAKRSLKTTGHDLYKLLLPEMLALHSSPGGDGDGSTLSYEIPKRSNPITTKRYRLLALWSGILKTDANGRASVTFELPQFSGEVRLMAVAYTENKFGSASKPIKVADDLILEPQIPRVLTAGDSLVMPVTVFNTTSSPVTTSLSVSVEGSLKLLTTEKKSVTIKGNGTQTVPFVISASKEPGTGKIIIKTNGGVSIQQTTEISVRPAAPFSTETQAGLINGNQTVSISIPNGFLKKTENKQFVLSRFPAVQFADNIRSLIGYPYGCIEQTVSKAFPQLYLEDLVKAAAPDLLVGKSPAQFVKEGIKKVESMQLESGAMAYWEDGGYESPWGSIYAAHFLIEAKKAGYAVSEDILGNLLKYIGGLVYDRNTDYTMDAQEFLDSFDTTNTPDAEVKASVESIYALYVLALAGKPDYATMSYYKSKPGTLSPQTTYLLAGAYAASGKWNAYYALMPTTFPSFSVARELSGAFDSDIRAHALMLNVLLDVEPANKQIPSLIQYLASKKNELYSTQEEAFLLLALGKAASLYTKGDVKIDVYLNGTLKKSFTGEQITLSNEELASGKLELKNTSQSNAFYFFSISGVKTNSPVKEEDVNIEVRRKYYDYKSKKEITDGKFKQGQLIVCSITLRTKDRSAENIAVSDMIPAGFEIENPRFESSERLFWAVQKSFVPDFVDVRDDRLLLFTKMPQSDALEYVYLLRVVNQGKFMLPAITAETMYSPDIHSANGFRTITVLPI